MDWLYFLGIERKFGTESASKIDEECWKTMGILEARQLKELIRAKEWSIPKVVEALRLTSWGLDQRHKDIEVRRNRAIFRVVSCDTLTCTVCPPGPHTENTWCEWEFASPIE